MMVLLVATAASTTFLDLSLAASRILSRGAKNVFFGGRCPFWLRIVGPGN